MTKRLRPLALQATAAERAEKLAVEIAALRAGVAALDIASLSAQIASAEERRRGFAREKQVAEQALDGLLAERGRAEEALAEAAGGREGVASTLYRLRSGAERLQLRREAAETMLRPASRAAPGRRRRLARTCAGRA